MDDLFESLEWRPADVEPPAGVTKPWVGTATQDSGVIVVSICYQDGKPFGVISEGDLGGDTDADIDKNVCYLSEEGVLKAYRAIKKLGLLKDDGVAG